MTSLIAANPVRSGSPLKYIAHASSSSRSRVSRGIALLAGALSSCSRNSSTTRRAAPGAFVAAATCAAPVPSAVSPDICIVAMSRYALARSPNPASVDRASGRISSLGKISELCILSLKAASPTCLITTALGFGSCAASAYSYSTNRPTPRPLDSVNALPTRTIIASGVHTRTDPCGSARKSPSPRSFLAPIVSEEDIR